MRPCWAKCPSTTYRHTWRESGRLARKSIRAAIEDRRDRGSCPQVHSITWNRTTKLRQAMLYQVKSNRVKSNQVKSNQVKSNQVKSNQVKSNQVKSNQAASCRSYTHLRRWSLKTRSRQPN